MNAGTDADTGQLAVESIRRWWEKIGKTVYPGARGLLITADSCGSNGSRLLSTASGMTRCPGQGRSTRHHRTYLPASSN